MGGCVNKMTCKNAFLFSAPVSSPGCFAVWMLKRCVCCADMPAVILWDSTGRAHEYFSGSAVIDHFFCLVRGINNQLVICIKVDFNTSSFFAVCSLFVPVCSLTDSLCLFLASSPLPAHVPDRKLASLERKSM